MIISIRDTVECAKRMVQMVYFSETERGESLWTSDRIAKLKKNLTRTTSEIFRAKHGLLKELVNTLEKIEVTSAYTK